MSVRNNDLLSRDPINALNITIERLQKNIKKLDADITHYEKEIKREKNKNITNSNDLNTYTTRLERINAEKQQNETQLNLLHNELTTLRSSITEPTKFKTLHVKKSPPRKSAKVSPPPNTLMGKMSLNIKNLIKPNKGGKKSKKQTMKKYKK